MKPVYILGVRIDALSLREAIKKARHFLSSHKVNLIFTPNPEMVVKAKTDGLFREVLNTGDLNLCDGKGLQLVSSEKLERITGIDFMLELCALAEQNQKSIFLLGSGSDEVVNKTAKKLLERFPKLMVAGMDKGPEIMEQRARSKEQLSCSLFHDLYSFGLKIDPDQNEDLLKKINTTKPDILFVAFGMGKQEKWLCENRGKMPTVRIAIGVGGAFDYISEKVKRAPCWMRKVGLEWLYRVFKEPNRLLRIVNATIIFLYLKLLDKIKI